MKKRVLALLTAAAMLSTLLTACGGSKSSGTSGETTDYGTGEITIWVAENVQTFRSLLSRKRIPSMRATR